MNDDAAMQETLEFAVLMPADVAGDARQEIPNAEGACQVTTAVALAAESPASLGFDPFSFGALTWVVLTFVGTTVAPVAQRIVRDYLWRRYQRWLKDREGPGLVIRLRNGHQITLHSDSAEELAKFHDWLMQHGRRSRS